MKSQVPVSLAHIAAKTGFSRMTVSNALRSSPKVKKTTASRIKKIAAKLGYIPDAHIATVMAGVRASKTRDLLPIAWLSLSEEKELWHRFTWLTPYLEGAREECARQGYKLDEHWLMEPGMSSRRISKIMLNRGIQGAIITPATIDTGDIHFRFDWGPFCWVSFENALLKPHLHKVIPAYYDNLLLALRILRRHGYRRIGLFLQALEDRRSHHMYLAALYYFQNEVSPEEHVRPLIYHSTWGKNDSPPQSEWTLRERPKPANIPFPTKLGAQLQEWIDREQPDVIVGQHSDLLDWLRTIGLKVPEDIGVVHLALDDDCADWAGIWQNKRQIGALAIQQLVPMIQRGQTGIPALAHETLIRGTWRNGKTLSLPH